MVSSSVIYLVNFNTLEQPSWDPSICTYWDILITAISGIKLKVLLALVEGVLGTLVEGVDYESTWE